MSSIIKSLRERLSRKPKEDLQTENKQVAVLLPTYRTSITPVVTYASAVEVYEHIANIKRSIDEVTSLAIGRGFEVSTNPDYKVTRPKPNSNKSWTAEECINSWNKDHKINAVLFRVCRDCYGFGSSFILKDGTYIPIKYVQGIDTAKKVLKLTTTLNGKTEYPLSNVTIFSYRVDSDGILGSGVLMPMMHTYGEAPSQITIYEKTRSYGMDAWTTLGNPYLILSFPGATDKFVEQVMKDLESDPTLRRWATNVDSKISSITPERGSSFDYILQMLTGDFQFALGSLTAKALANPSGYAPMVLDQLKEIQDLELDELRLLLSRTMESMWEQVLKENLFDPDEAQARLHWIQKKPQIEAKYLIPFTQGPTPIITRDEMRAMLRDAGVPLEEEEEAEEQ